MKWLNRLRHRGQEWDDYTASYVPEGWVAERQRLMDEDLQARLSGKRAGGYCIDCQQPINDHPLPERMWRRGADLCAQVRPRHIDGPAGDDDR